MRVKASEDVRPITDFRSRSAELVKQTKRTKAPLIITQRGRATAVLEDLEHWEARVERLEVLEQILRGVQDFQEGRTIEHGALMKHLKRKLDA